MNKIIPLLTLFVLVACQPKQVEIYQFRGDNRDGFYHNENLISEWPEGGPEELWVFEGIGKGYGSPTITEDRIYVTGEIDSLALLFALDLDGTKIWEREFGKEWMISFAGSRMAPTVVDSLIYVISGVGDMACYNVDGDKKWSVNFIDDLNGKNNRFGYSQSPLIDGDLIFAAPGGRDTNFVAMNRFTGDIEWVGKALGEFSTHCSPRMFERGERKIILTFSESSLIALDAADGNLLWNMELDTIGLIYPNTPIVEGDYLYSVSGAGNFGIKLKLNEDGSDYELIWKNKALDNLHGGFIKLGDYLITNGYRKQYLKSLNVNTGQVVDSIRTGRGSLIYADSLLYLYDYRGYVHLISHIVDAENSDKQSKLKEISKFKVKHGTKEHFSHAVINRGVMYIRHGNALIAYNIKDLNT